MIDHLNQQNALLSSQTELTVKLSSSEQELVKWRQQIADLESRPSSKLTKDQKSLLLHREEITALMEKNVAIEKNNRLIKESAEIAAWRDSLQASIDNRQQGYDIQIAGYGVGDKISNASRNYCGLNVNITISVCNLNVTMQINPVGCQIMFFRRKCRL